MAGKSNGLDTSEWARAPPSGPLWSRFLKNIYNPEDKSFLGRTAKRWGIVLVFYIVFYLVLALMFGLCMGGLFLTLDSHRPKYTLEQSLIGGNPGVTSRPMHPSGGEVHINKDNATYMQSYIEQLDNFFKLYRGNTWFTSQTACNVMDSYGLPDKPCFFIKLNKIYDWMPQVYDDPDNLPADMPEDLVDHINSIEDPAMRQKVWVSCEEEKDNMTNIEYPWGMGLPASFYPFTNDAGYRSPLVAVRLTPPHNEVGAVVCSVPIWTVDVEEGHRLHICEETKNVHTVIRCRAWAKNIIYNKSLKEGSGYTRIFLYIEDNVGAIDDEDTI